MTSCAIREPCVLLVEDDPQIRRFVRVALEAQRWQVFEAGRLQTGLSEAATRPPDLVILDLGLPDGDGNLFIAQFRTWSSSPLLVLSARSQEEQKVAALDLGADDFLSKPFGVPELLARVRAIVRRHRPGATTQEPTVRFGGIEVDFGKRTVYREGAPVHLTPIEYRLLSLLIANAGCVVTQKQILREVWGPNSANRSHYVRVYMSQLRQKLELDPAQPQHLRTETGVGYRFFIGDDQSSQLV